ncbi:MAG: hypothetical protein IJF19_01920 [Clostridia bacterium]|nr:hypothetical protein [Clostridia bacterium]
MKTCTFFGQRFVSKRVEKDVRTVIVQMIEKDRVELFLVGKEGGFNKMVQRLLGELEEIYPHIRYGVVFAYRRKKDKSAHSKNVIFPKDLGDVPRKYAVAYRNRWLIQRSDCAVVYVKKKFGELSRVEEVAQVQGLKIINVAIQTNA